MLKSAHFLIKSVICVIVKVGKLLGCIDILGGLTIKKDKKKMIKVKNPGIGKFFVFYRTLAHR